MREGRNGEHHRNHRSERSGAGALRPAHRASAPFQTRTGKGDLHRGKQDGRHAGAGRGRGARFPAYGKKPAVRSLPILSGAMRGHSRLHGRKRTAGTADRVFAVPRSARRHAASGSPGGGGDLRAGQRGIRLQPAAVKGELLLRSDRGDRGSGDKGAHHSVPRCDRDGGGAHAPSMSAGSRAAASPPPSRLW